MFGFVFMFVLAAADEARLNPITRVAGLLTDMSKKVAADGKAEQDLYDRYKCWCTKVINAKSESIESNEMRITELAQYIDDLSNGRVELTSERTDLEAEIKGLEKAIKEETDMREQENTDYVAAKSELDQAIAGLEGAIQTLGDATADHKDGGVFASVKKDLSKAIQVGKGFMSKSDVAKLQKAMDVPDVDFNKLNQDAKHKQKYAARSTEIQDILADMLNTFTDNRNEAVTGEETALANFNTLMDGKRTQLTTGKQALLDKAGENGARGSSLAESESEKSDLEGQNARDVTFTADTNTACATKDSEWSARKELRADELASIQQAIATLTSDDARDLFKKSFSSQTFLQKEEKHVRHVNRHTKPAMRRNSAAGLLRKMATQAKSLRLMNVANKVQGDVDEANPFAEAVASVDQMITDIATEETSDLATKEQCEADRQSNTQNIQMLSTKIDTNTETIDRLTKAIAAAEQRIADIDQQISDLNQNKADARDQRETEAAEHLASTNDDTAAIALVNMAKQVLEDFYTRNNLALTQTSARDEPFVAAGAAPTPPPSTWGDGEDAEYGGAKGEQGGIVTNLEIIARDIQKDIEKAAADETDAIAEYDKLVADIDATILALNQTKSDLEGQVANDGTSMATEKTTRGTNQDDSGAAIAYLKTIASGCDFMAKNFPIRQTNRQMESDGLNKAKAVLQGAVMGF